MEKFEEFISVEKTEVKKQCIEEGGASSYLIFQGIALRCLFVGNSIPCILSIMSLLDAYPVFMGHLDSC